MIRINLLPQKRRRVESAPSGESWLLLAIGLAILEAIACLVYHGFLEQDLAEEQKKNSALQAQIDASKAAIAKRDEVTAELKRLRAREEAIAKLQSARTGPTAVLLEIAKLLTPGRGPTIDPEKLAQIRKENPLAVFSPTWDTRRLWITSFEEQNRVLMVHGVARDANDVSELARRMNLSDYFDKVRLLPAQRSIDAQTQLELVSFALEAEVKY